MRDPVAPQVLGVLAGLVIGVASLNLLIGTAGCCGQPGNPRLLWPVYPYSGLLGDGNGAIMMIQMPFYGFMIGRLTAGKEGAGRDAFLLTLAHLTAVALLFCFVTP